MRLVVLDTDALIHRAYHALPPLSTQKGEPTNAIYGFFSIFIKMVQLLKPDYLVAAFDTPAPTFRKQAFDGYKAHRPKTADDLVSQLIRVKSLLGELGVLTFAKEGYEADDILGTIVSQMEGKSDVEVVIVTGDLDTLQLVRKGVLVYTMRKGMSDVVMYNEEAVQKRFGLNPSQLPDYKGLVGDASDNIPGVQGIGPKTAAQLLQNHGDLEHVFAAPDLPKKLHGKKDQALFSKELATINREVPISFSLQQSRWPGFNVGRWEEMFREFGFSSLLSRIKELPVAAEKQGSIFVKPEKTKEDTQNGTLAKIALWLLTPDVRNPEPTEPLVIIKDRLKNQGLLTVFENIEAPLVPILKQMQEIGICADKAALKELEAELAKELRLLRQEMFRLAGEEFNPSSPDQLRTLFFEKFKLSPAGIRKTPGGKISTQESELIKLADKHEIIPYILKHRELEKLFTTYITPLYEKIAPDGRIHTTFIQAGTATGRLASQNPNLQNIPAQGAWAKRVKNVFVAEKGFSLVSFDYSQIELRVVAHIAKDKSMLKAFKQGEDIHTHTASKVFGVKEEAVTPEQRRMAKVFNFGILYGLSAHGLSESLHISRQEAQEFIDSYFERFEGVRRYIERTRKQVVKQGYLQTIFGRKRFFPELQKPEHLPHNVREAMFREAVNFPVQGSATADIIKLAMISVSKELHLSDKPMRSRIRLLLQIHDDLLFEIQEKDLAVSVPKIKQLMESVATLDVPLKVEAKAGKRWGELNGV